MAPALMVPFGEMLAGGNGQTGLIAAFETGDMGHIANEVKNIIPFELIGYGWDNKFHFDIIARNISLIIGGYAVHTLANKLGANRQFKKIPLLGKYLTI